MKNIKFLTAFTLIFIIALTSISIAGLNVRFSQNSFFASVAPSFEVDTVGNNLHLISGADIRLIDAPNKPILPYYSVLFAAPFEKHEENNIRASLNIGKLNHIQNIKLAGGTVLVDEKEVHTRPKENFIPEALFNISWHSKIYGINIFRLDIFPFRYFNSQNKVEYHESIDITITFATDLRSFYHEKTIPPRKSLSRTIPNLALFPTRTVSRDFLAKRASADFEITAQDLENRAVFNDYLIITPELFRSEAERLCAHRRDNSPHVVNPGFITTETIYSFFANNHPESPLAWSIKSAIDSIKSWSDDNLTWLLFLGSGHHERSGQTRENFVPVFTFDEGRDFTNFDSFDTGDEYYVMANSDDRHPLTVYTGRLPARDIDELRTMVDKVIHYENRGANRGFWRNRVILVADDDIQVTTPDFMNHDAAIEREIVPNIPNHTEVARVYMARFPLDGRTNTKPAATSAMISEINAGALIYIYSGHGSSTLLADEWLFSMKSIPYLRNRHFPIMLFLSCDVGRFHSSNQSMAEGLLAQPDFGTVLVLAATKKTTATLNNRFGAHIVEGVYSMNGATIGEIASFARTSITPAPPSSVSVHPKVFQLIGDPATIITHPIPQPLVLNSPFIPMQSFQLSHQSGISNAEYTLRAYDARRGVSYPSIVAGDTIVSFTEDGAPFFSRSSTSMSGNISETFFVPRKVNAPDSTGKILLYITDITGTNERIVYNSAITIAEPDSDYGTLSIRENGPDIKFFQHTLAMRGFRPVSSINILHNHATIRIPATITVEIFDSTGIYLNPNYAQDGGYGGIPYSINKSEIKYAFNEFQVINNQKGSFSISLDSSNVIQGYNEIEVHAVNMAGGVSRGTLRFNVAADNDGRTISRLHTFPNPGKPPIHINFELLDPIFEGHINIYSSRGKLIYHRRLFGPNFFTGFNNISWSGRTMSGKTVGPGIYIVSLTTFKDSEKTERDEKKFKIVIE